MATVGARPRLEAAQVAPATFVVTARGELDGAASIELRDLLFPLVAADEAHVVLDLLGVHDLDHTCLGVIVSAAHMLERRGRQLTIVAASRHLTELVYAAGLDRIAVLERSLQAGLADAH